jgi:hypothetical protein
MAKNEKTSKSVASKASKILSNPKSSKAEKSVAASALTQAKDKPKGTGKPSPPNKSNYQKHAEQILALLMQF